MFPSYIKDLFVISLVGNADLFHTLSSTSRDLSTSNMRNSTEITGAEPGIDSSSNTASHENTSHNGKHDPEKTTILPQANDDYQAGVRKVEATTTAWNKSNLIAAYAM